MPSLRTSKESSANGELEKSRSANSNNGSSMEFISQVVASGLTNSFESMKEKVASTITENGEQYLEDALEKMKHSASKLAEWSKENPVKIAVALAAVLAVTAFLLSTTRTTRTDRTTKSGKSGGSGSASSFEEDSSADDTSKRQSLWSSSGTPKDKFKDKHVRASR
jgi:hypothetical protein